MSQIQTLSLAFGENADKAIELSRGRIGTLVSAISTPKNGSAISITKDADGKSLLSGFVKPAQGETMLESNKYILEKNNINVVGEVQRERYQLNLGGRTNVYEGNDVQIYCQNESSMNVSMQSMVVWIYADFSMVSKSSDLYNDSDIMAQFNVVRGADDYGWINLGGGLWRATLNDSMGMLKIAAATSNYSWTLPCYLRAYPASIDDSDTTTDAEREARLTDPLNFVAQAIAVTDATIVCSKENNIQAGDMLVFRVDNLLPYNNTKTSAVSEYSVLFTASEGFFDGAKLQVPDVTSFSITALITYMGMQISVYKTYDVERLVLTPMSNPYVFGVVREALGLPNGTLGISARQCADATAAQIERMLSLFAEATESFTFDEGTYFTCQEPVSFSGVINKCTSFSLGVRYLQANTLQMFYNNKSLKSASFPNLTTLNSSSKAVRFFGGCSSLVSVALPSLQYIGCDENEPPVNSLTTENALFNGCSSLVQVALPSIVRAIGSMGDVNGMFANCPKLESVTLGGNTAGVEMGLTRAFIGDAKLASSTQEIDWRGFNLSSINDTASEAFSGAVNLRKIAFPQTFASHNSYSTTRKTGLLSGSKISMLDMRSCNRGNLTSLGAIFASDFESKSSNLLFAHVSQAAVPSISEQYTFGLGLERYPIFVRSSAFSQFISSSGWSSYYNAEGYAVMSRLFNQYQSDGTTKSPWDINGSDEFADGGVVFNYGDGVIRKTPNKFAPMMIFRNGGFSIPNTTFYSGGFQYTNLTRENDSVYRSDAATNLFVYAEGTEDNFKLVCHVDGVKKVYCVASGGNKLELIEENARPLILRYNREERRCEMVETYDGSCKYFCYKSFNYNTVFGIVTETEYANNPYPIDLVNVYNVNETQPNGDPIKMQIPQDVADAGKAQRNRLFPDTWMKWMCEGYMRDVDGNPLSYATINGWINEEKGTTDVQYDLEDMSGNLIYEKLG